MQPLACNCYQETLSVANSQPPSGPCGRECRLRPSPRGPLGLPAWWMSWAAWGQAEGWVLKSSRVLTMAGHRPGSSSEPFPQTRSPRRPQQLECTDTALRVTALTGFSPSFKSWSSLDQLSPRKWPEVRVKLQGHCMSLLQVHLCGWCYSLRRVIVVS